MIQQQEPNKPEPIEECANDACGAPIYPGQPVYKVGQDVYCGCRCGMVGLRNEKIEYFTV